MSTFAVGEVAILLYSPIGDNCCHKYAGGDVEIKGPSSDWLGWYHVKAPDGFTFYAHHTVLRKKRPPPDWVKLCELDKLPLVRPREPA